MPIIHVYDSTSQAQVYLTAPLAGLGQVKFSVEPLSLATVDPEAEIISLFVTSVVDAETIAKMPKLKLIACRSTGFDNINLQATAKLGITVVNVPSYGAHTVAEYTFGLMLALTRQIVAASDAFHSGNADHDNLRGTDLYDKTLGIIGTGRIGRNVAAIASAFGMNILAYDAYPDVSWAEKSKITYVELDDLIGKSDVISLHLPYFPEVHHLIDTKKLKLMRPTAILVNTARGELVDTFALVEALADGKLNGAALDVFEGESMLDVHNELRTLRHSGKQALLDQGLALDILRKLPNVLVTNHNAFNTVEAVDRINQATVDNIKQFLAGDTHNNVAKK